MKLITGPILVAVLLCVGCSQKRAKPKGAVEAAKGSSQCKSCHPAFYKKWATSHHGLAMQPFTMEFARTQLSGQDAPVKIREASYRAVLEDSGSYIEELGPKGTRRLPMQHVLGGKNTYYLLTPMERGRLQVLPLGYDIQKKIWYDVAASGVRMHAEGPVEQPLDWTDSAFTFNTSCYSCHVSQLQTNYDVASDTYHSTWREPGINCETCHGNGDAHVALYVNNKGEKVEDMKILRTTKFTVEQRNEMCAPCHAKMSPISPGYQVTQRFFDHYDLVTLENPDFYPDGRDLGENYTYTSWLMNPCMRAGKFDCIHCHTSSGRYRFATENVNGACLPCHQDKATNVQAHSHHKAGSPGGKCIDCHMPKTRFANMNRSDHSLLPPTPAATLKYKSPNGCNLCHKEKGAAWADAQVRKWHKRDYQKPVLERAGLIEAARRRDWSRLPAMLSSFETPGADPVFKASLARLLVSCGDARKWPALVRALQDEHPLVRAAAAGGIEGRVTPETRDALAKATRDEFRLVRIRAAAALANVPVNSLPAEEQEGVRKATEELIAAYNSRPDDFSNHTNLGNFYMERGELDKSIQAFETAVRLRPDSVGTLVNASIAYGRAGRTADAERVLDQALKQSPNNAPANFNKGLLLAEMGRKPEAEAALQKALAAEPTLAAAAYNLCVMREQRGEPGALDYCRQAVESDPRAEKHAYTLAFYLDKGGKAGEALRVMEEFGSRESMGVDARLFVASLYAKGGQRGRAVSMYQSLLASGNLPEGQRRFVMGQLRGAAR